MRKTTENNLLKARSSCNSALRLTEKKEDN